MIVFRPTADLLSIVRGFFFAALLLVVPHPAVAQTGTESSLLIRDVRTIDFSGDEPVVREADSVLIAEGEIVAVGAEAEQGSSNAAQIVDGSGMTLMPGLYDMHVHIWDEAELGAYLGHGVTSVRNLSGMPFLLDMRDRIAAGALVGPRMVTSGPILNGPGPNAQINHQIVATAEEARAAVRAHHAAGYRRLKVYSNLSREAYEAIRDEAALLEMPLLGHTPEGVREPGMPGERPFNIGFEEILDDGFETIEHIESVVWHGLRDRHDEEAARALARRIAATGVPVDATLVAFGNLYRVAESGGAYLERPGTDLLNPFISAMEAPSYERWRNEDAARASGQLAFYKRVANIFQEEGVSLLAGSDSGIFTNIPGISLHDELDLLIEAGLTPYQALRTATVNAAVALGEGDHIARIAPGYRADLLLIVGDPLSDVAVLRSPHAVIAGGRLIDRAGLDALLGSARQTDAERTQRNVLEAMAAQGSPVPGQ